MSKNRGYISRPLTRPRTKVYDCNYDIGQQYYKSTLDSLDRKYGSKSTPEPVSNGTFSALRAASTEREKRELSPLVLPKRRPVVEFDDDEFVTESPRSPKSASLLNEFDSIFENRGRLNIRAEKKSKLKAIENDMEEEIASSLSKLRASRARARANEDSELVSTSNNRSKFDLSEGSSRADESHIVAKRRVVKVTTSSEAASAATEGSSLLKWSALNSDEKRRHGLDEEFDSAASLAAAARAKKSRARLDDLELEMQELADKNAAREKRIKDLRSFLKENDVSDEKVEKSVKMKSSVKSERKMVSF